MQNSGLTFGAGVPQQQQQQITQGLANFKPLSLNAFQNPSASPYPNATGLASSSSKVTAPYLDVNAIRSQARASATSNVNPLYDLKLNSYLQNEALQTQQNQTYRDQQIKNYQDTLSTQLQGNQLGRDKIGQNTDSALANIANQEGNYQAQTGMQADASRRQLLNNQGALAGSGVGQQADLQSQQMRGLKEGAQEQAFKYSAETHQQLKNQTLDQLANSDVLANLSEQRGETTSQFDLNNYLRNASFQEGNFRTSNEQSRQGDIDRQTAKSQTDLILKALQPYLGTPQYQAGLSQYGV